MKSIAFVSGTKPITLVWGDDVEQALGSAAPEVRSAFFGLCDAIEELGPALTRQTPVEYYEGPDVVREYALGTPYFRVTCTVRGWVCELSCFVAFYEPGPSCDPPGGGIAISIVQIDDVEPVFGERLSVDVRKRDRLNVLAPRLLRERHPWSDNGDRTSARLSCQSDDAQPTPARDDSGARPPFAGAGGAAPFEHSRLSFHQPAFENCWSDAASSGYTPTPQPCF